MADGHAVRDSHPVHEELGGYEGSKLGMWLFLATELLLFGVMFALFAIFHAKFATEFKLAHHSLNKWWGGLNTLVLITSSLTVALALDAVQRGKRKRANLLLISTIFFAGCFMVVKYIEYTGKFNAGIWITDIQNIGGIILPGDATHSYVPIPAEWDGQPIQKTGISAFFAFYFLMTGVHGLHVVIGASILGVILIKNMRGRYSHWYYTPVENGALYWHLVDLIWIYLFPLFYLVS